MSLCMRLPHVEQADITAHTLLKGYRTAGAEVAAGGGGERMEVSILTLKVSSI